MFRVSPLERKGKSLKVTGKKGLLVFVKRVDLISSLHGTLSLVSIRTNHLGAQM